MLRSWLALFLSPSTALASQSVLYALVTPSCSRQAEVWLHASAAVGLSVVVVLGVLAWTDWVASGGPPGGPDSDGADAGHRRRFVAVLATAVSALSLLVIAAMWIGIWMLSPCSPWP